MASSDRGLAQFGRHTYSDSLQEARRCRQSCALFDFSFVTRAMIRGGRVDDVMHAFQPRKLDAMQPGEIYYSLRGDSIAPGFAVKSDLTIWKMRDNHYEIYSGRPQDIEDLKRLSLGKAEVQDLSTSSYIFSLQGPDSLSVLEQLDVSPTVQSLRYFGHEVAELAGNRVLIGRLGYTGEAGFELITEGEEAAANIWNALSALAAPAGMDAADILRIEAGFILFLNECRLGANTAELGVHRFTKNSLADAKLKLVCFQATSAPDLLPFSAPEVISKPKIGEIAVTSANRSQFTNHALGLGFIRYSEKEGADKNDPTGDFTNIRIVSRPFHDQEKTKPRIPWK